MPTPRSFRNLRNTGGYTIDQTILIVAIIAILVTLIIITVGWQLINRTSGTKLASQFKQIEDANGLFYSTNRIWVHQSYSAPAVSPEANMLALAGVATTWNAAALDHRNFVPGFRINGTSNVQHNFGAGAKVTMSTATNPFGLFGTYLVVEFYQVPFSEIREAERAMDAGSNGTENYSTGRVVASTGAADDCTGGTVSTPATAGVTGDGTFVNVCYAANLIQ